MKYILVTGAWGGMGRKTVKLLRQQGFCVFALDRKAGEAAEGVIPLEADVTDPESLRACYERVNAVTHSLHAIVHFAGIYVLGSMVEAGSEQLAKAVQVNLLGVCAVNRAFFPLLKEGSRIVITTSELAPLDPLPFTGIYAMTKGALDKYAYSLRMELQLLGISVSVLRAGAVETDMIGASVDALEDFCAGTRCYSCNADRFKRIVNGVEARRVPPEKIAQKVWRILSAHDPKFSYAINRNPLLLLLNALPHRLQFWAIRQVLKP